MLKRFPAAVLTVLAAAPFTGLASATAAPKSAPKPTAKPSSARTPSHTPSRTPAPFRLSPKEYIPVSEIRPGMTGYGLTVFKGVKIEKFGVKVIGVMPQGDMGRPLVLVMLSGGPITQRKANLIQGMSGSPIYIKGRLLGAFALGESTGREPMGMVRPIDQMIDAFDPRLPNKPVFSYTAAERSLLQPYSWNADLSSPAPATANPFALPGTNLPPAYPGAFAGSGFTPAPLAVMGSGFGLHSLATLNAWLRPLGMEATAMPGGGGAFAKDLPSYFPRNVQLVPGASLAVSLMQGDVDMTAVGTVTYRRGDRILGFGHPWTSFGAVELPMSTAYVHDVFSSIVTSHKYASPIETVGSIVQDGPFSVAGVLHKMPHMVPLNIHVSDETTGRNRDFHIRVANHPMLLPGLTVSAAQEVIDRVRTFPGDTMATVSFTLRPDGYAPIKKTNTYYDPSSISTASLVDMVEALLLLSRNPFEPVRYKSLDMNVTLVNGHNTATVERAWVEKDKVEPGDNLTVQTVIKPFMKPAETRTVTLKIPENAPAGQAQVVVFGGQTGFGRTTTTGTAAPGTTTAVGTTSVANVKQLIAKFEEREKNNELGVRVLLPGSAVSVNGERFSGLPDPLAEVMKSSKASSTRLERDEVRYAQKMPYVLAGAQMLTINIEKKNALDTSTASSTSTSTSTSTPATTDSSDESDSDTTAAIAVDDGDMAAPAAALHGFSTLPQRFLQMAEKAGDKPADAKADDKSSDAKVDDAKTDDAKADDTKAADDKTAKTDEKAADKTDKTDKTEKTDETDTDKDGKGPGRLASVWKQSTKAQFEKGKLENATVTSVGDVEVAPTLTRVAETTRPYVWSLLPEADGSILAGTGNNGEILRVAKDGKQALFTKTGELEIQSLARDAKGNIYAGTSPHGLILKVSPDGKATTFYNTKEKYVLSLAVGADGTVYAGTGPDGKLFSVSPDGTGKVFFRAPEAHILSLAVARDGAILAGTGPDGLLYRITPKGDAAVLYDAPEANLTAVTVTDKGDIFVASAPNGKVYKVMADGRAETYLDKPDGSVLALLPGDDGSIYAAGGKKLYHIAADKTVDTLDNDDQNQLVSLARAADGSLYAGSANTGVVYRAAAEKAGSLLSSVHDAGLRATWGRMEWMAVTPDGAKLQVQTRSGNTAQPDETWSDWSAPLSPGSTVPSPPARFIQYRATLADAPDGDSPSLRWISVRYLTDNRPPTVKFSDPKEGDTWSGTKTVKWTGTDPDSDLLTYTLYVSSDNGTTWKKLNGAQKAAKKDETKTETKTETKAETKPAVTEPSTKTTDAAEQARREAKNADTLKQVSSELDKYPNLSADVKKQVLDNATAGLKSTKDMADAGKDTGESLSKATYSWDTTKEADGTYILKVVASDKSSNPGNALTADDISSPVLVTNAKPSVTIAEGSTKVAADGTVTLQGEGKSASAAIVRVSYRVDKGTWQAAIPADGIFDGPQESWKITTDPLSKGEHTIEVKATDEVDNSGTATTKVTIP